MEKETMAPSNKNKGFIKNVQTVDLSNLFDPESKKKGEAAIKTRINFMRTS